MGFILFLLILVILIITALMLPLKFTVYANFSSAGKYVDVLFIKILRINVTLDGAVWLKAYLFNNRIYKKKLQRQKKKGNSLAWMKSAVIVNKKADICYGMKNPFWAGMASGALGAAAGILELDEIDMHPDFFSTEDYMRANGSAEIILGNTISNYVKNKRKSKWRGNEWIKT